ncbi:MAG: hypothetical protein ACREAC_13010 [Blastocatellia bacterium]
MTNQARRRSIVLAGLIFTLFVLVRASYTQDKTDVQISNSTFKCITKMTKVRGFYVDNVLGNLDGTLRAANSKTGGTYPPGSVVQLVPTEVMIKHQPGWNKATNDWEFFELEVAAMGSKIKVRGVTEVKNRFGGNCFNCHVKARPEWDMICETDHGCAPIPLTAEMIGKIQQADPRCK